MKHVFDGWKPEFVTGLEIIRLRDESTPQHPLYITRSAEVYKLLAEEIRTRLSCVLPDLDIGGVTLGELYDYHSRGKTGDPAMDVFSSLTDELCDALRIARNVYNIECLFFTWFLSQDREDDAFFYFEKLLRPAVMLWRIREVSHIIGRRGGRSKHRLHAPAMKIALRHMKANPGESHVKVARYTRNVLAMSHRGVPAVETIRKWLSRF